MHTQQEIVKLYNSLFPKIVEDASSIKVQIKGQTITVHKQKKQATVTSSRQTIYGR
jgi:hypothetical protein